MSSGDTLVDVVSKVFTGLGNAVSMVKNVATQALNAIKTAGQFILNAIFEGILNTVTIGVNLIGKSLSAIISTLIPSITSDLSQSLPKITIGGSPFSFGLEKVGDGIKLVLGDFAISIQDILSGAHIETETLSLSQIFEGSTPDAWLTLPFIQELLLMGLPLLWSGILETNPGTALGIHIGALATAIVSKFGTSYAIAHDTSFTSLQRKAILQIIAGFHFSQILSGFVDMMLSFFKQSIRMSASIGIGFLLSYLPIFQPIFELISGEQMIKSELWENMIINLLGSIFGSLQMEFILSPIMDIDNTNRILSDGNVESSNVISWMKNWRNYLRILQSQPGTGSALIATLSQTASSFKQFKDFENAKINHLNRLHFGLALTIYHLVSFIISSYMIREVS